MTSTNINTIIIFGSSARGDSDADSDVDICIISNDKVYKKEIIYKLKKEYDIEADEIVIYNQKQFKKMANYGSLFLWHIKLEGRILYDDGFFNENIKFLKKYEHHKDELIYHSKILEDQINFYNTVKYYSDFDLSLLFTICRNTCMILCNLSGIFIFGRKNVIYKAIEYYSDLPIDVSFYNDLSKWKLRYERGGYNVMPLPNEDEYLSKLSKVRRLLDYAIETS